jgi:hypothetical protein
MPKKWVRNNKLIIYIISLLNVVYVTYKLRAADLYANALYYLKISLIIHEENTEEMNV